MEPELIRREIDKTAARVEADVQRLAYRARHSAQTAFAWTVVGIVAAGVASAMLLWRFRGRRGHPERHRERAHPLDGRRPTLHRVRVPEREARTRSTA